MVLKHDYSRFRAICDEQINKFGMLCVLRRSGSDRQCTAAILQFTPMERLGKTQNPLDRKALVSALAPDGSVLLKPDFTKDSLITYVPDFDPLAEDEVLRIIEPAGNIGPADKPMFWRLTVRR